jgi:hypothetical protein
MNPDFLDLLRALLDADARFLIVGAYAVGIHGRPRDEGPGRLGRSERRQRAQGVEALTAFGAPLTGLTLDDLRSPGVGLQIGV